MFDDVPQESLNPTSFEIISTGISLNFILGLKEVQLVSHGNTAQQYGEAHTKAFR